MRRVQIYHPVLDRTITVAETSISQHSRAGWISAEERPAPETAAPAEPAPNTDKRRGRSTKE